MARLSEMPVSKVVRQGIGIDDEQSGRKTKDEYRRQKDLEEERKLGIEPAMVDVNTGRDINPHIPEFIAKNPWYVPSDGPTLQHQRPHDERQIAFSNIDEWYKRGPTNTVASKYRKGACENCGSLTHKKKDCFERPRKLGACWTGEDIAPDEYIQPNLALKWDAKRDRWNGYDPESHKQVVEEYEKLEQTRKLIREEKIKEGLLAQEVKEPDVNGKVADDDMYADDADMAGVTVDMDSRTRITVRNLRIREDTAKYLHNLDPNGPYYDPKSRSMRENPFANIPGKEKEAAKFAGENFVRYTGEVIQANEAQVFAWQARCKGIDVHALAEPTKLEALKREYELRKHDAQDNQKNHLLEMYGGAEHLNAPPRELLLAQSENYIEYSRAGKVIKGQERSAVKSRYEEDRFINNHKSVWGSYWKDGKWGFSCCHCLLRNSYCCGDISDETERLSKTRSQASCSDDNAPDTPSPSNKEEESKDHPSNDSGSSSSSDSENLDSEEERRQLKEMASREREEKRKENRRQKRKRQKERKNALGSKSKRQKANDNRNPSMERSDDSDENSALRLAITKVKKDFAEAEEELKKGDRGRRYHSTYEVTAPTDVEMEAYKLTTIHSADPMASYLLGKKREK